MKKGLLYLFMLAIGAVSFTSCSDDDPNWQKLPEEIKTENLNLSVNGTTTNGTVTLDVKNEDAAVLNLQNIIPGVEAVAIDVDLVEKEDGSFDFQGEKQVTGIQVRNEITPAYIVKVQGNVTTKGEMKATLTINLNAASINGTVYADSTLKLTYGGEALIGKQVAFATTDGQTASLTLAGIIPGEPKAVITNITLTADGFKCNFSGETSTAGGTKVNYTGSIFNDTLTLSLDATLSDNALAGLNGTWNLYPSIVKENGVIVHSPAYVNWVSSYVSPIMGIQSTTILSEFVRLVASNLSAEVLHDVTFEKDGSIKARYYSELNLPTSDPMALVSLLLGENINIPADRNWQTSPKNLAFWYVSDSKLYIVPDIPMIIQQVAKDGGKIDLSGLNLTVLLQQLQTMTGEEIKDLLSDLLLQYEVNLDISSLEPATIKQIVGWLSTGIPLNYELNGQGLNVYLGQETVDPLMKQLLLPLLPTLKTELVNIMEAQYPGQGTDMYAFIVTSFLGIYDLEELRDVWLNTNQFNLGLEFQK